MTLYNLDFDISAIAIYLVIIFAYMSEKRVRNTQTKIFSALVLVSMITPIADIPAAILIEKQAGDFSVLFWNSLYYLSKQGTTFFFLSYIMFQLEMHKNMGKNKKIFLYVPIIAISLLILTNPFTNWIFSYSNGIYERGPLRPVCFAVTIFYYIWALIYVLVNRADFHNKFHYSAIVICTMNVMVEIIQLNNSSILLHSMSVAISILLLYLDIERQDISLDKLTGFAKKSYLIDSCKRMILNHYPFHSVLIRVLDLEQLIISYGEDNIEDLIYDVQHKLVKEKHFGNAFRVSNSIFVINIEQEDHEKVVSMISSYLNDSWKIGDMEIRINYVVSELSYPDNISNIHEYVAYLEYFKNMKCFTTGVVGIDEMHIQNSMNETKIEEAIVRGMKEDFFELYYQPICTAKDQRFVTAEALLRLKDPEMGFISPDKFIPVAEKSGQIIQIGEWVLENVAKFIATHDMKSLGLSYIEVNLSTIQCLQSNFIDNIVAIMEKYHVDPGLVCLEITETATIYAPELLTKNLQILRDKGFLLALDDYGTGYSNLQRMLSSAFHIVKFDKDMTQHLSSEENLRNIFVSQQSMFHILGSKVVAEGVETQEQYEFLKEIGCDYIQGYYFSKPVDVKTFCEFLKNHA